MTTTNSVRPEQKGQDGIRRDTGVLCKAERDYVQGLGKYQCHFLATLLRVSTDRSDGRCYDVPC